MNNIFPLPATPVDGSAPLLETNAAPPIVLQYWDIARRHLWLVSGIIGATLIVGVVLTLLVTPRYTATARIQIQREQANVTNVEALQPEQAGQNQEFYQTQYSLLNARSLAERVVKRLRLAQDVQFQEAHNLKGGLLPGSGANTASPEELRKRERNAVDILLNEVSIGPVRGSALVDVSYRSSSPALSASIANVWVEEFIRQSVDRRFTSTADARHFLESRLQALRERLERSETDLVGYAEQRNIVRLAESRSVDGRTNTTQTLLGADIEALNQELVAATSKRVEAEGQRDAAKIGRSNGDTIASPAVNELRASRAEKAGQYAQLLERVDPEYADAQALKRQIGVLDKAIASEEQHVLGATTTAYQAALQRENMLRARLQQLLGNLNSQNRATIQYNIYQREVDTNRQLYDGLLQRYKEIGVAGVGTSNIAIVDSAIVPTAPSSPKLMLNLALALLAGVAFASAAVFVLENLDEGVRSQQQVTELLGLPLLGTIPSTEKADPLDAIADPKTVISEAYMTVRTNLGFATDHGFPRSIAVTSAIPGEGKSTSSYALAHMLARTGKRVLLVDIDLRRPRLAQLFSLDKNARGVSNYLAGDDDWKGAVQAIGATQLSVMSAGPIPPSAPELLSGERLQQLVRHLLGEYDNVIFDSPPLLGLADTVLIAEAVEGVVMVVEVNRAPIRAVRAAVMRLKSGNAHIFGAILTRYRATNSSYGYGYGYNQHYAYGNGSEASAER